VRHLETFMQRVRIKPAVNQFETHPLYVEEDTIKFCKDHNILIEAYSSLAKYDQRLI
jgi:diketogulonate reductase-like aldo/keto reductase